jgi:CRP-like cAMP-binding protein
MAAKLRAKLAEYDDQNGGVKCTFEDGDILIRQGEPITANSPIYVLISGVVGIVVDGIEVARRQGTYIGENAVMGQERNADVAARGRVTCIKMNKTVFAESQFSMLLVGPTFNGNSNSTSDGSDDVQKRKILRQRGRIVEDIELQADLEQHYTIAGSLFGVLHPSDKRVTCWYWLVLLTTV